ncbi:Ferritin-like domain-containing protein [Catalinimonas alkaloidigena]|uniref:Ferritin-like domain-containing protein n=1 Tax=Catalinimonas alkaloidigena TaxID=1075417 RepID=A0A1G9LRE6_9BACT|nr:ferritin-like domain-containing protein [Catalinimonas alkaloidigena]SDL64321.1 Ferritin-like domain-containing protein [Catalinimonas alkaloidigena]
MSHTTKPEQEGVRNHHSRRNFLLYSGATVAATGLMLSGCEPYFPTPMPGNNGEGGIDLGSGDVGILNYAYALEQLEAAFYTKVIDRPFGGMTSKERDLLEDLKEHEIIHREFFKAALGTNAIPGLEVDFSGIDFSDRMSVLGTAKAFEDLGVSAYNGAGRLIKDVNYLLLAGKIVSVEARHAAAIRSIFGDDATAFAGDDIVDPLTGLDVAKSPQTVLATASKFLKTKLNGSNLPTM